MFSKEGIRRALPRYKCHKEVGALKIAKIVEDHSGATIHFVEEGYGPEHIDFQFIAKHSPEIGGYIVLYDDGYVSWSPAVAFETGYTKV